MKMFGKDLFRCVVEDNKDPEFLGRVRLRVIGVHDPVKENVKTEELPWSDVLQSPGKADIVGGNVNVPIGTWGYCLALDDTFTKFLMIGSIPGVYSDEPTKVEPTENKSIGFFSEDEDYPIPVDKAQPCNPLEIPDGDHSKTEYTPITVDSFTEPENTASAVEYPHNKVYEDHNGNIIEIDGTKDNPRIRVQHSTGTRIDINTKGDISIQASNTGNIWFETPGLYAIDSDGNMIIEGDLKIVGSLEVTENISAGSNIVAGGEVADSVGNLSSVRDENDANVQRFNSHTHIGNLGAPTAVPDAPQNPDPKVRQSEWGPWQGTPV
jgi:hypothetical protein